MPSTGTDDSFSGGLFEVVVEPRNDQYDPDDDGWRDQVATLYAELDDSGDTVRRGRPIPGAKGAVDQLVIAMGSAGVFTATADCLRAWLGRDRDRRIDLRWMQGGEERRGRDSARRWTTRPCGSSPRLPPRRRGRDGGRYRALLIGNSTYLADEHNLQTLKGPVKDIAALNRALIDPHTGLFADVDVALLPEATSGRVIKTMGRFFGTAARNDVLLVYFSGHGKLDQSGRLHLCMQDTESTDLLSTAVSSAGINEFADACHARTVIIVLDCCHAGAFRGSELGDAVAQAGTC